MACPTPPGVMEQEQAFLTAFATTTGYRIDAVNNRIELLTSSDQPRIVFSNDREPLGTGILDGTDWILVTLNGVDVPDEMLFTLILRSSQFTGKADCVATLGRSLPPRTVVCPISAIRGRRAMRCRSRSGSGNRVSRRARRCLDLSSRQRSARTTGQEWRDDAGVSPCRLRHPPRRHNLGVAHA